MTDQEFNELWTNLVHRSSGTTSPPLTRDERLFYAVNLLRGSVPRSGFIGYFENFTGREIHDAHDVLKELNLDAVLSLLQQAQAIALGDRPLQDDALPIHVFPDSLTEKEYEETSDRLDAAMQPLEKRMYEFDSDIWRAICQFAAQRHMKPRG